LEELRQFKILQFEVKRYSLEIFFSKEVVIERKIYAKQGVRGKTGREKYM
jgi:hypothetical protein